MPRERTYVRSSCFSPFPFRYRSLRASRRLHVVDVRSAFVDAVARAEDVDVKALDVVDVRELDVGDALCPLAVDGGAEHRVAVRVDLAEEGRAAVAFHGLDDELPVHLREGHLLEDLKAE